MIKIVYRDGGIEELDYKEYNWDVIGFCLYLYPRKDSGKGRYRYIPMDLIAEVSEDI